jgi:hypothetical protein
VDEDDKELLYRAIYTSMKDPQIQRMFHTMSAKVENAPSIGPAPEQSGSRSRSLDIEKKCFPGKERKATIGEFTVAMDITNNPPNSIRGTPQIEDMLEKDRNESNFDSCTDRRSNPLLRIMQHRPSGYSGQSGTGNASVPQWIPSHQGGTTRPFHYTEAQSPFWKFVSEFRKPKDVYKAVPGAVRRAYIFVPQVRVDLHDSRIEYKIAKLLLSQSEIALALSHWRACKSGRKQFDSSEPSQRQATNQIEAERGKLFPRHFVINSIQYTNPRTFSNTTVLLKSHDIIVVVEEIDPEQHQLLPSSYALRERKGPALADFGLSTGPDEVRNWVIKERSPIVRTSANSCATPLSRISSSLSDVSTPTYLTLNAGRISTDVYNLNRKGMPFTSAAAPVKPVEDFVDELIREFGIPVM